MCYYFPKSFSIVKKHTFFSRSDASHALSCVFSTQTTSMARNGNKDRNGECKKLICIYCNYWCSPFSRCAPYTGHYGKYEPVDDWRMKLILDGICSEIKSLFYLTLTPCPPSHQDSKSSGRSSMSRCRNSVSTTTSDDQPHIGNYRLLKTIGKGNFAKVKLARHVLTGKEVSQQAKVDFSLWKLLFWSLQNKSITIGKVMSPSQTNVCDSRLYFMH